MTADCRIGAALIAINMLFAIGLVHRAELFALVQSGGSALELRGMFLFTAIALALIGPGRFGINGKRRWKMSAGMRTKRDCASAGCDLLIALA